MFYLVALLFIAFGIAFLLDTVIYRKKARKVLGKIVGYERIRDNNTDVNSTNKYMYTPIAEYEDKEKKYRLSSNIASSSITYNIGEKVEILLFKDMHSSARIKGNNRFLISFFFSIMGIGAMYFAILNDGDISFVNTIVIVLFLSMIVLFGMFKSHGKIDDKFDYKVHEDGFIGYQKDKNFVDNSNQDETLVLKKVAYTQKNYLISFAFALLAFVGTYFAYMSENDFMEHSQKVEGVVLKNITHIDSDSKSTMYTPLFSYKPVDSDRDYTFSSAVSSSSPSYSVGEKVDLLYDTREPSRVHEDNPMENYIKTLGLLLVAFIFLVLGMFYYKSKE